MDKYTLEMAYKDIAMLNQERIAQLNRLMATEALLKAVLAELDQATLETLAERYDMRVIAAMQQLELELQREHLWEHYQEKIQEVLALRRRQAGQQTTNQR